MTHDEFVASGGVSYSDWFGSGNTLHDYLAFNEKADQIYIDEFMVLAIFPSNIRCFGYDGNEYCHTFTFQKQTPSV